MVFLTSSVTFSITFCSVTFLESSLVFTGKTPLLSFRDVLLSDPLVITVPAESVGFDSGLVSVSVSGLVSVSCAYPWKFSSGRKHHLDPWISVLRIFLRVPGCCLFRHCQVPALGSLSGRIWTVIRTNWGFHKLHARNTALSPYHSADCHFHSFVCDHSIGIFRVLQ